MATKDPRVGTFIFLLLNLRLSPSPALAVFARKDKKVEPPEVQRLENGDILLARCDSESYKFNRRGTVSRRSQPILS